MIQLEDRIYVWPNKVQNFQSLISSKAELNSLASPMNEEASRIKGSLYNHQKAFREYMIHYNEALIMDPAGVGKTRKALSFPELCVSVKLYPEKYPDLVPILKKYKKFFILTSGPNAITAFKKALFCEAVEDDRYNTPAVLNSTTKQSQKTNITKALTKHGYRFTTYSNFATTISNKYQYLDNEETRLTLGKIFADTVFIIDEVHNLINVEQSAENKKYEIIKIILNYAIRRKVILMSATPMSNTADEIYKIANLLIGRNFKLPIWLNPKDLTDKEKKILMPDLTKKIERRFTNRLDYEDYYKPQFEVKDNVEDLTIEELEIRLRGSIFFVEGSRSNATPVEVIKHLDDNQDYENIETLRLYATKMEPYQEEAYVVTENNTEIDPVKKQNAIFAYPDNMTPSEGYNYYIKDSIENNKKLKRLLKNDNDLKQLSCKFYEAWKLIDETVKRDQNGKIIDYGGVNLIYIEFKQGSGIDLFGLFLESRGYERFTGKQSAFNNADDETITNFCGSGTSSSDLVPNIREKLRYCYYTSGETAGTSNIMDLQNCKANWNGAYSKICLLSKVGREGVSFLHVTSIHMIVSQWNNAVSYQISMRGLRSGSHEYRYKKLREKALKRLNNGENVSEEELDPKMNYYIYRYAAYITPNKENPNGETIDTYMYKTSHIKYQDVEKVMIMLKSIAADCQIQTKRNYPINKINCYSKPLSKIDYTTYDIKTNVENINDYIYYIKRIFRGDDILNLNNIYDKLKVFILNVRKMDIVKAIRYIISNRISINDKYGYKCYLFESGNCFYTSREYPIRLEGDTFSYFYSKGLNGYNNFTVDEVDEMLTIPEIERNINILKDMIVNYNDNIITLDDILNFIEGKKIEIRAKLFEEIVLLYAKGVEDTKIMKALKEIINYFDKYILVIKEPVNQLKALRINKDIIKRNSDKPKDKDHEIELVNKMTKVNESGKRIIDFDKENSNADFICVHCMLLLAKQAYNSYRTTMDYINANGKLKLLRFKDTKTGWRICSRLEQAVYRFLLKKKILMKIYQASYPYSDIDFNEKGIPKDLDDFVENNERQMYGIILDKNFYMNTDGNSEIRKLKDCLNYSFKDLVMILVYENFEPPENYFPDISDEYLLHIVNQNSFDAIRELKTGGHNLTKKDRSRMNDDQILLYYRWILYTAKNKSRKPTICPIIKQLLLENNQLVL